MMSLLNWGSNKSENNSNANTQNAENTQNSRNVVNVEAKIESTSVEKNQQPQLNQNLVYNYEIIEENYRQIFVDRLNQLGIDGESFCHELMMHKCIMAGSFPLQCLLGEYYENSDIDVFISNSSARKNSTPDAFNHPFEK